MNLYAKRWPNVAHPNRNSDKAPIYSVGIPICNPIGLKKSSRYGIFAANSGILTMTNDAASNCAAPEMAYSLTNEAQTADTAAADSEATYEKFSMPPAAAGSEVRAQSEADNGACAADSSAAYGTIVAYAACISTGSEVAVQWVENTLGQTWISGTVYSLTAEEYAELLSLLENNNEDFEIFSGNGELYQLLAR